MPTAVTEGEVATQVGVAEEDPFGRERVQSDLPGAEKISIPEAVARTSESEAGAPEASAFGCEPVGTDEELGVVLFQHQRLSCCTQNAREASTHPNSSFESSLTVSSYAVETNPPSLLLTTSTTSPLCPSPLTCLTSPSAVVAKIRPLESPEMNVSKFGWETDSAVMGFWWP